MAAPQMPRTSVRSNPCAFASSSRCFSVPVRCVVASKIPIRGVDSLHAVPNPAGPAIATNARVVLKLAEDQTAVYLTVAHEPPGGSSGRHQIACRIVDKFPASSCRRQRPESRASGRNDPIMIPTLPVSTRTVACHVPNVQRKAAHELLRTPRDWQLPYLSCCTVDRLRPLTISSVEISGSLCPRLNLETYRCRPQMYRCSRSWC